MRRVVGTAALVLVAAAGCGGASDGGKGAARATVHRYLSALGRGDAGAACREFTDSSREALTEFAREAMQMKGASCQAAVGRLLHSPAGARLRGLAHADVQVADAKGDKVEVRIAGVNGRTDVVRSGGGWRIASKPTGERD